MEHQITASNSDKGRSTYFDYIRLLFNRLNDLKELERQKLEHCSNLQQQLDQANKDLRATVNRMEAITNFLKILESKTPAITGQSNSPVAASNSVNNSKTGKKRLATDGTNRKMSMRGGPRKIQKAQISTLIRASPSILKASPALRDNTEESANIKSASSPEASARSETPSRQSEPEPKRRVSFATSEGTLLPLTEDEIASQPFEADHRHSVDNGSGPMTRFRSSISEKGLCNDTSINDIRRALRPRNNTNQPRYREEEEEEEDLDERKELDDDSDYSLCCSSDELVF